MTGPDPEKFDSKPKRYRVNGGERIGWFLLGITPIPVGLLLGPLGILNSYNHEPRALFKLFTAATITLTVTSGVGLSTGFRKSAMSKIPFGLILAVCLTAIDLSVIFFAGCCSGLSNI
jgi:hypothetical protein